jgi:hypothetical protein
MVFKVTKGLWSEDYVNSLPDGSFLWVQEGGEKDDDWRTIPRALRHWPVRDDDWQIDMERLRAALPEVIDAPEQILPLTQKPAVLLNAARMMMREIEIEAPKAGMTPEVVGMLGDLVSVLQATAAIPPVVAVDDPAATAAPPAPAPAAPAAEPAPAAPAATEAAKDAGAVAPTEKAALAKDDGWGAWQAKQAKAQHESKLLKRKRVIRR